MKRFSILLVLAIFGCVFTSCNREVLTVEEPYDHDEVVFRSDGFEAEVSTKATAVTDSDLSTNGFSASCVTGAAGSDSAVWSNIVFTKSGSYWKGGKYWPTSNPSYRFYAVYPTSYTMTAAAGGATIAASNAHDIVCAYASSSTYKTANTLTFNHIFARLGSVTVNQGSPYTISSITISITPKTGGTYNLRTGAGNADGTGWSGHTTGSATTIANKTGSNSNDIYLVPGTYTLTASWTATNTPYTKTFSGKTVDVALVAGKTNNITCTLTGDGTELQFGVSLTAWSTNAVDAGTVPLVNYPKAVGQFTINAGGDKVGFAPGNLQAHISAGPSNYIYTADEWRFAEHQWEILGNTYSIGNWIDYFRFVANGATYDSYGLMANDSGSSSFYGNAGTDTSVNILKTDWGEVPGVVSVCGENWKTLTADEMSYIMFTRSSGATVKGTVDARYTYATIRTDVTGIHGMIIFPDNVTITADEASNWGGINVMAGIWATRCTAAQWEALEAKGCVFLPTAGFQYSNTSPTYIDSMGYYWTSSGGSSFRIQYLEFNGENIPQVKGSVSSTPGYSTRLVKAVN